MARFVLFAFPAPREIVWTEANIPAGIQDAYAKVVERLQALQWAAEEPEGCAPRVIPLTRTGKAAWVEWVTSHYAELNAPDLLPKLRGPWAKLEGYCGRLALVLHMTRVACSEVNREAIDDTSVLGAAALIDYFKSHARLVYAQLHASPEEKRMEAARHWMSRHGGEATVRDLYRYKVAGCTTVQDAETLFEALVSHGYGSVVEEVPPTGGHRRKIFRVQK